MCCQRFKEYLYKEFLKMNYGQDEENIIHDEYLTFARALGRSLKIKTGKEALDLLLNSERVNVDIRNELEYGEDFEMKIILRQWDDYLIYEAEFRCFVYDNNLTAISQYDYNLCVSSIINNQKLIPELIKAFFDEKIKKKLESYKNYVIDVGFTDDEFKELKVIEINPFNNEDSKGTGGSLFNWEKDIKVLKEGPLEFRFNQTINKDCLAIVPDWQDYIEKLKKYTKEEQGSFCILQ
jgi:hypothetical protein